MLHDEDESKKSDKSTESIVMLDKRSDDGKNITADESTATDGNDDDGGSHKTDADDNKVIIVRNIFFSRFLNFNVYIILRRDQFYSGYRQF